MEGISTRLFLYAVAACAVMAFLWYFVHLVGDNASKSAVIENLGHVVSENNKATIEKVENEKKFQSMDAAQLDAYGRSRGWMRSDDDR